MIRGAGDSGDRAIADQPQVATPRAPGRAGTARHPDSGPAPLSFTLGPDVLHDFDRACSHEWLEANGLGGWASSSVTGAHTRRYHGLLVAALDPPVDRRVLLSRLDETLVTGDGRRHELAANAFPAGELGIVVAPRGHRRLERFTLDLFPSWEWRAGEARLRKTVTAVHGENTVVVTYELGAAAGPCTLELRPFFAARDYHALVVANDAVAREGRFAGGVLAYRAYEETPSVFVSVPSSEWLAEPDWWRSFHYARETERGFRPDGEDLFTPGLFRVQLAPGARLAVIASLDDPRGRDGAALVAAEEARRRALVSTFGDPLARRLALAADPFIVRRGDDLATIIAGYPWFADWGRDTMIALPGVCLATGRLDAARRILLAFAGALSRGLLPNRFPDRGEAPEFNTVDATLWWLVAVWRYLEATIAVGAPDDATVRALLPALDEALAWHRHGTLHGIHEDDDGLLAAGEPGVQLTWMDARVGDRVVTPRTGKPVEIQALWINAQLLRADLADRYDEVELAAELRRRAARAGERFVELFWSDERGFLADCVAPDGAVDATLRPNQLVALSLPHPVLDEERSLLALAAVERELLTPVGLRTLPRSHPGYCPHYEGGPEERDAAYHQGTVWPWLLGPYVDALVRLRGELGRMQARAALAGVVAHLGEAGLGSVSEIFDAEPPHTPRGCPAQAWSVGELLRARAAIEAPAGKR